MKVLLIQPVPPSRYFPRNEFRNMHVPTGVASIGSLLKRAGHEVRVHVREEQLRKCNVNWAQTDARLEEELRSFCPDLVGVSVMTPFVEETERIARLAKELCSWDTRVVVGGVHPTALGREMLETTAEIDVAVIGEGEQTMLDLAGGNARATIAGILYRDNGKIVATGPRPVVANLDELAPIDYGLFDMAYYTAPTPWLVRWLKLPATNLRTSRGCTNACLFCAGHLVGGLGVRFHSVDFVVDRMRLVIERFGVRGIHFEDDTLGADPDRLVKICEAIRRRGLEKRVCWDGCLRVDQADTELLAEMKASGCIQIEYGFESASDRSLAAIGKKTTAAMNRRAVEMTRHAGLRIYANVMIGLPGETAEDLRATCDFLRWVKPDVLSFGQMVLLPGCALFQRIPEEKRRRLDYGLYAFPMDGQGVNLTAMSDAEFARTRDKLFRYFAGPSVRQQLLRDAAPEDEADTRILRREMRRFMMRHPVWYSRLAR